MINPNDFVKHIPTGEEWVVCGINYQRNILIPCGYPFPTMANISDCELIESRNLPQPNEYKQLLERNGLESFIELEIEVTDTIFDDESETPNEP